MILTYWDQKTSANHYISKTYHRLKSNLLKNLTHSSFITIFAYNGFQSVVQLSEEAKDKSNVPKSIAGSLGVSAVIYALIAISIISLIGVKKGSSSVNPISDAFSVVFGGRGKDIVVIIAIICLTNTFLIATLSRSRLLQKLADRGIAPKVFTKLTSLQKVLGLEKFTNGNANNGNAVANNGNANNGNAVADNGNAVANNSANEPVTLPILAIITVSVVTYILTFIKRAIEALAKITSGFIFFIFTVVNFW